MPLLAWEGGQFFAFLLEGAEMVGATVATVGSPVAVAPPTELQSIVERLDQQVQDLSRRQAMMEKELAPWS